MADIGDIDKIASLLNRLKGIKSRIAFMQSTSTYKFNVVVHHRDNSSRPYEYAAIEDGSAYDTLQNALLRIEQDREDSVIAELKELGINF